MGHWRSSTNSLLLLPWWVLKLCYCFSLDDPFKPFPTASPSTLVPSTDLPGELLLESKNCLHSWKPTQLYKDQGPWPHFIRNEFEAWRKRKDWLLMWQIIPGWTETICEELDWGRWGAWTSRTSLNLCGRSTEKAVVGSLGWSQHNSRELSHVRSTT